MATLKDVARKAGVSLGTASKVLSGVPTVSPDLRRRVEKAKRDLGYRPNIVARSLKTRRTRMLGMVISDITNPFFPEMVRGAEDVALERGFILTTFNTDDRIDREQQVFEILRSRGVDGLLVVVALPKSGHDHLQQTIEARTPIVFLDRRPENLAVDSVTVDNEGAVRDAIEHLVALGHKDIGYLGGDKRFFVSKERLSGFLQGLRLAGLQPVKEWIREGNFRPESGYDLACDVLSLSPRPTAIFVANMLMTIGVLRALRELALETPRDIALATFDHYSLLDGFRPTLTSIVQPSYEIGRQGAELLMDRIEGRRDTPDPIRIVLPTRLRLGESTQRT